jgi:hypothetical protein
MGRHRGRPSHETVIPFNEKLETSKVRRPAALIFRTTTWKIDSDATQCVDRLSDF